MVDVSKTVALSALLSMRTENGFNVTLTEHDGDDRDVSSTAGDLANRSNGTVHLLGSLASLTSM